MRDAAKKSLLLLLMAGAAAFWFVMADGSGDPLPPQPDPDSGDFPPPRTEADSAASQSSIHAPAAPRITETEAVGPTRQAVASEGQLSGYDFAQGIEATVVDPAGRPVKGARVFLMEGSISALYQRAQALQDGAVFPPIASGETDQDGRVTLGVGDAIPRGVFQLRITTDVYADHKVSDVRIRKGDWQQLPIIRLERGASLRGRVTIAGSRAPVPLASVFIEAEGDISELAPTPGREDGLVVPVDENGDFACDYAPIGMVTISAVAPHYARSVKRDVELGARITNQVSFQLNSGTAIRGTVTDNAGAPIAGAVVHATPLASGRLPSEKTRTDDRGRFELLSLVDSSFQLTAMAEGFRSRNQRPVRSGTDDVRLVLERRSAAFVKVYGHNRLLQSYALDVKRYYPTEDRIADLPNRVADSVHARDLEGGFARVENLSPGTYVVEVRASGFARTFSEPFRVATGTTPPRLEVRMSAGGTLTGTVTDSAGRPLAEVAVLARLLADAPDVATELTGLAVRETVLETSAETDADGHYQLEPMPQGRYRLEFSHEAYCPEHVAEVELDLETIVVPGVTLQPGTLVHGTTTVARMPTSGVQVVIQREDGDLRVVSISDTLGEYVAPVRLPPGTYTIQATTAPRNGVIAGAEYDLSRQTFIVAPNQDQQRRNLHLPRR